MLRRRDGRQPLLNNGKSTYAYCKNTGSEFIVGMFYKQTAASGLQSITVTIRTARFMDTEQHFGIETRLQDGRNGVSSPAGVRYSPLNRSNRLWGPTSAVKIGYRGSFPRVKRPGREFDHSLPPSANVQETTKLYFTTHYMPSMRGQGHLYLYHPN